MRSAVFAIVVAALVCLSAASQASSDQSIDAAAIRAQQAQIRMDVQARKGRFKDFKERKREDLFVRQQRVEGLLDGVALTTELSEPQRIELFNQLEAIEALVNSAEDDRLICERHKPVGSKRPQTVCMTVAQRRAANRDADRQMTTRDQR